MREHVYTAVSLFCGGGGMARGAQDATQRFRDHAAKVQLVGAYDFDPFACQVYAYLTGSHVECLDARKITREDLRQKWGEKAPHIAKCSAPCKGSSTLLSKQKAATPKYEAMNDLSYIGILTLLDAYRGDEPAFLLFENVPNITSRARKMLVALRTLLRSRGYVLHDGFHDARKIGNLAQRRKRWFMVARNPRKVPVFLYRPPCQPGQVCGDVLTPLPLPGDPAGGAMHAVNDTSMINLLRLWAIPAGGDWRDLLPNDGTSKRARGKKHQKDRKQVGASQSSGATSVTDPRSVDLLDRDGGFNHVCSVAPWDETAGTVTSATSPSNGAPSVADPRAVSLIPPNATGKGPNEVFAKHEVAAWGGPTRTVIGGEGNGACGVQDPRVPIKLLQGGDRFRDALGVLSPDAPSGTVTGEAAPSTGKFAYADSRAVALQPQAGNDGLHHGKYVVTAWDMETNTVVGATRVGSGAPSVADPRINLATADSTFHHGSGPGRWGVLSPIDPSGAVTGNARVNTGPFSYAAPPPTPVDLIPPAGAYDASYGVLDPKEPSHTIASTAWLGCGAYALADDVPRPVDLALGCAPHAGAYGVAPFDRESATILAHHKVDNAEAAVADPRPASPPYVVLSYEQTKRIVDGEVQVPFAIIDPAQPETPLAIVDDLTRAPFRWVAVPPKTKRGKVKWKRETVALVLISKDGTWHRPLTTLELAVLQGLPWLHNGVPLDFQGGITKERECLGNMVPPPVAQAMTEQMLLSLLVADTAGFVLASPDTPVWVRQVRALERALRREGYVVVKGRKPMNFTTGEFLDDGHPIWQRDRPKTKQRKARAVKKMLRRVPAPMHVETMQ